MTRQLDELRHWISSLEQRTRLFEQQPNETELATLEQPESEDLKA